ncbi:gamma-glutamyltransferase [Clostridium fermenticellae]|uniref:Glutathione hydrolase proenzyme n=1 Tax=Clostridium fermenticellae TaxID=2068654 RepID=A0A386H3E7_9CLOT|nr:gamma-glutamyltransferase [Clostridium fermenticellae]AYD40222.1 gamma-glutamyltransferase [Clostridium fermenticellae]
MKFNALYNPFKSIRTPSYGKRGMVATSQPFAAEAGFEILKKGGNAVDAAIATAACLTVCEPTSNGIGGDAFAIVWFNNKLHGLNASGQSPKGISIPILRNLGYSEIPGFGWEPVNIPGIPAAWAELSKKFGTLPFETLLEPAIKYAEEGFPITPTVAKFWKISFDLYKKNFKDDKFKYWFETFSPNGRSPHAGEMFYLKDHAKTLKIIAETKSEAFYRGILAEKIDYFSRKTGGYIRKEDMEKYHAEWVEPISINYRGYDVFEIPPNGQGITALIALNILKGFNFNERDSADTYHKQIEAVKLAFEDTLRYVTDINKMTVKIEDLLSDAYAEEKRKRIDRTAFMPKINETQKGGTVYLATADNYGNMVSYIQSLYQGFGSGLVVPGTGIALHNRGKNFSFDPEHINALEPEKKPYHTIIPGFLMKNKKAIGPFGIMGAFMQPQAHVQVLMNCLDFNLNPQAALDAPRWMWTKGKSVNIEHAFPKHIAECLHYKGHNLNYSIDEGDFGRGQIIWKDENGVLSGGTDWRTDGTIYAW